MINIEDYVQRIEHAICENGLIESVEVHAFKLDDHDGIAVELGFHSAMICKADYFTITDQTVRIIELSDLEESAQKSHQILQSLKVKKCLELGVSELTSKQLRPLRKAAWAEVTREFKSKWCGSIAAIERLLRKNNETYDPTYRLVVVCKNSTEVNILDDLKTLLQGMMGPVKVCNTDNVAQFV